MADKKVIRATADYTGGGIYIITGAFQDGTFFLTDTPYEIDVFDADPDAVGDDAFTSEWFEKHSVHAYGGSYARKLIDAAVNWISEHRPDGNYVTGELRYCFTPIDER